MDQVGADTAPMRAVVERLRDGEDAQTVLSDCALPAAAATFGKSTFEFLRGPLLERAAIFFHGREDVIPRMFMPLVQSLQQSGTPCGLLLGYLERHIQADGEHHGPLARRMLEVLFDGNSKKRAAGVAAAQRALNERSALWDAVVAAGVSGHTR